MYVCMIDVCIYTYIHIQYMFRILHKEIHRIIFIHYPTVIAWLVAHWAVHCAPCPLTWLSYAL